MRPSRRQVRLTFVALLVVSSGVVLYGAVTAERTGTAADVPEAPPRESVTVATESARYGTIMAWHPNGTRLYYDDEHTKYFDVDPVEGEAMTVEYTATDTVHSSGPTCSSPPCARNYIERANLSTGETEVIYARYDPEEHAGEWHDHDRINETHVLVADIVHDQVFMINTETELIEWAWDAQADFPVEGGGPYPEDWAHINDVDLLPDGRIMVSLRNQDQVVFVDPGSGLQENWTLGSEDDYDTLYEQHNPDYIPEERGGPAVVVADSETGRIVEYQREDGEWSQSWEWSDARMQWPRDADRLPNGNTLVTDTHGSRLLEIAPNGSLVWSVDLAHPYDVERLGTGEDSTGGPSAARADLQSTTSGDGNDSQSGFGLLGSLGNRVEGVVPAWALNGLYYISPIWMGGGQFLALGVGLLVAIAWTLAELRWRFPHASVRSPLSLGGDAETGGDPEPESETKNR